MENDSCSIEIEIDNRRCVVRYSDDVDEIKDRRDNNGVVLDITYYTRNDETVNIEQFKTIYEENQAEILLAIEPLITNDFYKDTDFTNSYIGCGSDSIGEFVISITFYYYQ